MASCSLATLRASACANGFLSLAQNDPKKSEAVLLQLWYNLTGKTIDIEQLLANACSNEFKTLAETDVSKSIAVQLQQICNVTSGSSPSNM